jgi:hypothetical protein
MAGVSPVVPRLLRRRTFSIVLRREPLTHCDKCGSVLPLSAHPVGEERLSRSFQQLFSRKDVTHGDERQADSVRTSPPGT